MEDYLSIEYWEFIMGVMMGKEGAATPSLLSIPKDHTHITHSSTPLQSSHIEEKNGKQKMLDSIVPPCDNQVQEDRGHEISIIVEEECHLDSSHKVPIDRKESASDAKEEIPQEIRKRRKVKQSKVSLEQDKDGKFLCKGCHRPFSTKYNARRHELSHKRLEELEGGTVYHEKCGQYNKIFFNKGHFQAHCDMHNGVIKYKCPTCNKAFTRQDTLISHSYVHLGEEEKAKVREGWKNNCYFCSKKFSAPSQLIKHMVTHTKERAFTCLTCRKTFTENGTLTRHNRGHNEETRPLFKCGACEKSFTQKGSLSVHHKTVHLAQKNVPCPQCFKPFGRRSDMVRHMKAVHLKETHKCPQCPKTYSDKSNLQKHIKKEHQK